MRSVKVLMAMMAMMAMGWMAVGAAQQAGAPKDAAAAKEAASGKEAAAPKEAAGLEQHDAVLDAAGEAVGSALFLRCLCAENNLSFDAEGRLEGDRAKTTDWTLAAVNVLKVERRPGTGQGPGEIELEGVRVAMRYATDRHEFDRHPQNTEKMKILVADSGDVKGFQRALRAIFAVGIDVPLQRSLPEYWQHYFDPQRAWEKDEVTEQTVVTPGALGTAAGVVEAEVTHKTQAGYTDAAGRDKVQGTVAVRMVVDAEGEARRIAIAQPLGYGLDERAAEATAKLRFSPAVMGGKPVASNVLLRQEFVVVGTAK
jgi:TonB family protein